MEKIYITGTGRSGTTFLIKIFTFLNFDTGFTRDNYTKYIFDNCGSGMEKNYTEKNYIIKSPFIMSQLPEIINDTTIKIKTFIIPVRDYKKAAISRVHHTNQPGGLWNAIDEETQIQFYNKIISEYVYYMTKYEIDTIFLDFDKMISDKEYLFNKLKKILDEKNISIETFSSVYDEVSSTQSSLKLTQ
jgi:hypothetical protein